MAEKNLKDEKLEKKFGLRLDSILTCSSRFKFKLDLVRESIKSITLIPLNVTPYI